MTTAIHRTKWFLPLFSLALGVVFLVAFWAGGNAGQGVASLGIMAALGAVFLLGGRSETIRGLRGDGRDERWERIDVHATAFVGIVLITAILAMCFWEWAHGRDGSPYAQLGAIAGVAYVAAVGWMRWRG
jgi:drug/metabolite transporter (DMT)-like permease